MCKDNKLGKSTILLNTKIEDITNFKIIHQEHLNYLVIKEQKLLSNNLNTLKNKKTKSNKV